MAVQQSLSNNNFWGLVEQKGPWRQTKNDRARSRNGIGIRHPGHGDWKVMVNPYQQDGTKPKQPLSRLLQQRVNRAPLRFATPPPGKGRRGRGGRGGGIGTPTRIGGRRPTDVGSGPAFDPDDAPPPGAPPDVNLGPGVDVDVNAEAGLANNPELKYEDISKRQFAEVTEGVNANQSIGHIAPIGFGQAVLEQASQWVDKVARGLNPLGGVSPGGPTAESPSSQSPPVPTSGPATPSAPSATPSLQFFSPISPEEVQQVSAIVSEVDTGFTFDEVVSIVESVPTVDRASLFDVMSDVEWIQFLQEHQDFLMRDDPNVRSTFDDGFSPFSFKPPTPSDTSMEPLVSAEVDRPDSGPSSVPSDGIVIDSPQPSAPFALPVGAVPGVFNQSPQQAFQLPAGAVPGVFNQAPQSPPTQRTVPANLQQGGVPGASYNPPVYSANPPFKAPAPPRRRPSSLGGISTRTRNRPDRLGQQATSAELRVLDSLSASPRNRT